MNITARRTLAASLALMLSPAPSPAQSAADPLEGIWASESVFETSLRGELVVRRDGSGWRATLAGAESRFTVAGESVRFAFPGDRGGFRGVLAGDGTIAGFWLQPSGETEDRQDPGGSGQPPWSCAERGTRGAARCGRWTTASRSGCASSATSRARWWARFATRR